MSSAIMGEDLPNPIADSGDMSLPDIIRLCKEVEDLRLEPRQEIKEAILRYSRL